MRSISRRGLLLAAPVFLAPAAARAALMPTPGATEGPFYPTALPADDDSDLVRVAGTAREAGGDVLRLRLRVLDREGRPLSGVRVEIWQCDANGVYRHPGDRRRVARDAGFQGFGHAVSDARGEVAFRTIVPVPYPGRTPHIHVKLWRDRRELLTTQLYLADHPQNARDFLFRGMSPDEQERVSMVLTASGNAPRPAFETDVALVLSA